MQAKSEKMGSVAKAIPDVSVCIITYNQVSYIKECLMSVFAQEHPFTIEVIVADDGSTDGTQETLLELANEYPIKLILANKNRGVKKNLHSSLSAAKGRFVALLEGDDYWVDKEKLSAQILRMRADHTIALSYTSVFMEVTMFGVRKIFKPKPLSHDFVLNIRQSLSDGWFGLHTCTLVMSSAFLKEHLNSEFFNESLTSGDWPIAMHGSVFGKIDYLEFYSACYRVAPGSIMNSGITSRAKLIKESREWWEIFRRQKDVRCLSRDAVDRKIRFGMRELGFVPATLKSADLEIDGVGFFEKSMFLVIFFKLKRQGYLFKRWFLGKKYV